MAGRTPKPDETQPAAPADQPNPAVISTREYSGGNGWQVGQTAPADAFRALGGEGMTTPTGPVVHEHPGGHARQIVAKGGLVTEGVRRELDDAEAADGEQG